MRLRTFLLAGLAGLLLAPAVDAGVLMQGFYWDLPSPAAGGGSVPWWWDKLGSEANEMRRAGITAVWLPCPLKGASGGYSMGYDPYDDYDIGSKNQKGTIPTRFGTREQLQRSIAMMRANGLDVYLDTVLNHRNGDPGNFSFQYVDAYGNWPGGRYPKSSLDFTPAVANDPDVFDNPEVSFGPNVAVYNGGGIGNPGYNNTQLKAAGDWLVKALDVQGFRFDYAKGVSPSFVGSYLSTGATANKFAVAEIWDGNISLIQSWIAQTGNKSSAFDFPLRFLLKDMCDGGGFFDMRRLDGAGLKAVNPLGAVTFVENHDTDHNSGPIINNKLLAYAHILTSEGYPCVFYKDWNVYGLKAGINNLVWIHEKIAVGSTTQRWKDDDVFAYTRNGGSKLLVGLNDNGVSSRTVTVQTDFGANVSLHDYTGHSPDVWTNSSGQATITIPANVNGGGYVCYSVQGITGGFTANQLPVVQEFAGAQDLDIKPADNTQFVTVGRIWVQAGKPISAELYWDATAWTGTTNIQLELRSTTNSVLRSATVTSSSTPGPRFRVSATRTGWYTFRVRSNNTPATNLKPKYWLKVGYTAPPI
jgi:alpha-amylase